MGPAKVPAENEVAKFETSSNKQYLAVWSKVFFGLELSACN